MKNNILNIINFVRASEPRSEDDSFLLTTFKREVDLCVEYNFPATFLFQYDSLVLPEYTDYIKTVFPDAQTGLWFETVGQLVKKCGIEWRGRNDWDWHNDVGFLIGYTPKEREKLIDEAFDEYKNVFGKFPSVIGSWHIDAYSLNYISKKYHVDAACICKEQTGTDGYTLWGGVYSGAYFPSVNNMLCPAQTRENQTDIPVFRMLGSDPIAQYENGIDTENKHQGVDTLEPVYPISGASEKWVRGFLENNYNGKCLALAYAQAGQENSFGEEIFDALPMQFKMFDEYRKEGKITIETLGESGRRFSAEHALTPPQCQCFDYAPNGSNAKTAWYNCANYRANLHSRNGELYLRDLHIFDETVHEDYLDKPVTTHSCGYYTLPVEDGLNFTVGSCRAGIFFTDKDGQKLTVSSWQTETEGESTLRIKADGFTAVFTPKLISISSETDFSLCFFGSTSHIKSVLPKALHFSSRGTGYALKVKDGLCSVRTLGADGEKQHTVIDAENGKISFEI